MSSRTQHPVMRELAPGLWHWQAPHPDWQRTEPWDQKDSSYAINDGERLHSSIRWPCRARSWSSRPT
jgi:hypothetical protein